MAPYAIIAGAGTGVGRSLALRFARASYSVVLLARSPKSYESIVEEVRSFIQQHQPSSSGSSGPAKVLGLTADVSDPVSVAAAFAKIEKELPAEGGENHLAAAVFNANAGFAFKPALETTVEDISKSLDVAAKGLLIFSHHTLPLLQKTADSTRSDPAPPSLIVTGATASVRGSAKFSAFAAGKFAQRGITHSLAREYGPKGVHVSLAVIDGAIDVPWREGGKKSNDTAISPDAIAESYWHLHTQPKSSWTLELDLRPYGEKF